MRDAGSSAERAPSTEVDLQKVNHNLWFVCATQTALHRESPINRARGSYRPGPMAGNGPASCSPVCSHWHISPQPLDLGHGAGSHQGLEARDG